MRCEPTNLGGMIQPATDYRLFALSPSRSRNRLTAARINA
jgi:hypothetical protein